jgi:hypothetical protein
LASKVAVAPFWVIVPLKEMALTPLPEPELLENEPSLPL